MDVAQTDEERSHGLVELGSLLVEPGEVIESQRNKARLLDGITSNTIKSATVRNIRFRTGGVDLESL